LQSCNTVKEEKKDEEEEEIGGGEKETQTAVVQYWNGKVIPLEVRCGPEGG